MSWRNVFLVARRELRANLFKKSMLIGSAIVLAVLIGGAFFLKPWISSLGDAPEPAPVGLSSEMVDLGPILESTGEGMGQPIASEVIESQDAAETALTDKEIDLYVTGTPEQPELLYLEGENSRLTQVVTASAQSLGLNSAITELGGDPAEVLAGVGSVTPTVSSLKTSVDMDGSAFWVPFVALALLFFGIVMTGTFVSTGVVEEKTSRVVEILLATIRPSELFAGKVIGNGIVGLGQVLTYGAGVVAAVYITGLGDMLNVELGYVFLWTVVWFLLGFATYVVIWGGLAALVSRQEDIGSITTPVMFMLFIPFYTGMYLPALMPEAELTRILSMLPFLSPFMMPSRLVITGVPAWEMAVAVGLSLLVIAGLVWVAARIYHNGVLHTGSKMKFTDALKSHR